MVSSHRRKRERERESAPALILSRRVCNPPGPSSSTTPPHVERARFNNYRYRYRNERNWLLRQFQFAEQSEVKWSGERSP